MQLDHCYLSLQKKTASWSFSLQLMRSSMLHPRHRIFVFDFHPQKGRFTPQVNLPLAP